MQWSWVKTICREDLFPQQCQVESCRHKKLDPITETTYISRKDFAVSLLCIIWYQILIGAAFFIPIYEHITNKETLIALLSVVQLVAIVM